MDGNSFLILFLVIFLLAGAYFLYFKKMKGEPIKTPEEKLTSVHIFPDYTKNMPYECKAGEKLKFILKGYSDKDEIREVPMIADYVIWKKTKGNGEFRGDRNLHSGIYSGTSITFVTPGIDDPYDKEKLIFVSAHYLEFTDATWIKIVR